MLTSGYSDMSHKDVVNEIQKYYDGEIQADVFIVDIREPEEIERLKEVVPAITIFIDNDRVPAITSNAADANVENYEYDFHINNDGTLDEFEDNIKIFLEILMMLTLMAEDYENGDLDILN
jgi:hypothetical protein